MASMAQSANQARSVSQIQMQKELCCLLAVDCNQYQQVDLPKKHHAQLYRWPALSSSGYGTNVGMASVVMATRVVDVVVVPGSDMVMMVLAVKGVSSSNSAGQELAHMSNG